MAGPNTNFPKVFTMTLLLVGIIGISSALTVSKAATTTIKIMPCGDSVTAGIGDPNMGAYRTELYNLYKNAGLTVDFVGSQRGGPSTLPEREHEGHSGWTIPQVASNVNNWLNTYNPDAMLLWIGGNDILQRGQPNPTGLSNLIDQITTAKPNLKLFVANYYHLPTTNSAYAQQEKYITQVPEIVSAKQAAGKKVYFVKLSEANLASSDIASDNLHLSPAGYQKIAQIWYKYTVSALNPTVTSSPIISPSPTPSVSKSPTPTVHPTPSATVTSSFAVAYTVNDWGGGASVSVTIKNNGTQAVNGWSLEWTFPGNQKISNMWNATYTQSGASVTAKSESYNSTLPAGGSVTFGFNLTYSGSNAKPTGFRLNGTPCATID